VAPDGELATTSAQLADRRTELGARQVTARVAAFTSQKPGSDTTRLAHHPNVDLLLMTVPGKLLDGDTMPRDLAHVLLDAPCDVAALVLKHDASPTPSATAPVLIPFGGAEHEWAAAEVGAWIARSVGAPLRLLGTAADPKRGRRDASRLLATASLAIQQVAGVVAEPVIAGSGPGAILDAAQGAGLLVIGIPDLWQSEGLGIGRLTVIRSAQTQVILVRGGTRPGGLAPDESMTRYTWSLDHAM
jgi:hypothetical protein